MHNREEILTDLAIPGRFRRRCRDELYPDIPLARQRCFSTSCGVVAGWSLAAAVDHSVHPTEVAEAVGFQPGQGTRTADILAYLEDFGWKSKALMTKLWGKGKGVPNQMIRRAYDCLEQTKHPPVMVVETRGRVHDHVSLIIGGNSDGSRLWAMNYWVPHVLMPVSLNRLVRDMCRSNDLCAAFWMER